MHIPTFSNVFHIEDAVLIIYITSEGLKSLSRLMWVISNYNNSIMYAPQIVCIASFLLIYLNEAETYGVITKMIRHSIANTNIIAKYFTFNQSDFGKLVAIISKVIKLKKNELVEFFTSKNIKIEDCVRYIVSSFGIGYFSYTFLSRVLSAFIIEANKALIKLISSVFIIYSGNLMEYKSGDIKSFLAETFQGISFPDNVIIAAFKIKLTKCNIEDIIPYSIDIRSLLYYRPHIAKKYDIIGEQHMEIL